MGEVVAFSIIVIVVFLTFRSSPGYLGDSVMFIFRPELLETREQQANSRSKLTVILVGYLRFSAVVFTQSCPVAFVVPALVVPPIRFFHISTFHISTNAPVLVPR